MNGLFDVHPRHTGPSGAWGRAACFGAGVALWLTVAASAHAGLVVMAGSVEAGLGTANNRLEFSVTNTGSEVAAFNGFALGFEVDRPELIVEDVTINNRLTRYVFHNHSLFGPSLLDPLMPPGQFVVASDLYDVPGSFVSLAPGQTRGLGVLLFTAPDELMQIGILLDPDITSLSLGEDLFPADQLTLVDGQVVVTPEPGGIVLAGVGALALAWISRRRRD
ncbi:MAG: MYXO-CTERM sorting domain-containing protein [Planctomycetaceae bacterium]